MRENSSFIENKRYIISLMTNLSIIILNYNTKDLLNSCIQSLFLYYNEQIENDLFEIVVVDNDSQDESVKFIKQQPWFSKIKLVQNKENVGFSKGENSGVHHAKGKYLLFLNSDTLMQDKGLIDMVIYLEKQVTIGILGGRLQNMDGSFQASAGVFYTLPNVLFLLMGAERFGHLRYSPKKVQEVDWISGAMMMVEKKFFESLGGFDERIFMYMEDMELCFRVKQRGKTVVFYPMCTVKHISHGSSNRNFAIVQIFKGLLYFYKKHTNSIEYSIVKGLLLAKAVLLIFIGTVTGKKLLKERYAKALQSII